MLKYRRVSAYCKTHFINNILQIRRGDSLAYNRREKNGWALFLLILAGIVLGGFLGELANDVDWLKWINNGKEFGFENPIKLELGILYLEFLLMIRITIASILGIALAIFLYRKL